MTEAAGPGVAGVPIGGGVGGGVAAAAGRSANGATTKKTAVRAMLVAPAARKEDGFTALCLLEERERLLLTVLI
jgi:hypothetical protein